MNSMDLDSIKNVMAELWPKSGLMSNDEQVIVWTMAFGSASHDEVVRVLRDHAVNSKYPPKPIDIRERLAIERKENESQEGPRPAGPSRWEVQRQYWAKRDPAKAGIYLEMSDADTELAVLKWEYDQQVLQSGPSAASSVRYWRWQHACWRHGYRATEPEWNGLGYDEAGHVTWIKILENTLSEYAR